MKPLFKTGELSMRPEAPENLPLEGHRVLVAEDDPVLCQLICEILEELGSEAEGVNSGDVALSRFSAALGSPRPYHVVIVDLRLPILSGSDTLSALRELDADTRLVAISGSPPNTVVRTALDRDRVGFLPKPFGVSALLAALLPQ
mgnify:CR=1 FL=1